MSPSPRASITLSPDLATSVLAPAPAAASMAFRFITILAITNFVFAYSDRGILKLDNTCALLCRFTTPPPLSCAHQCIFAYVQHL